MTQIPNRGDFSFVIDANSRAMLMDAFAAVKSVGEVGWQELINEPPNGFMFTPPSEIITKINEYLYEHTESGSGHSGTSYGWTMRQIQFIARLGWNSFVNMMRSLQETNKNTSQKNSILYSAKEVCIDFAEQEFCAICIERLDKNLVVIDNCITGKKCGHIFHESCIREWLNERRICPLCLEEVTEVQICKKI
jgi:hypothetical protein